MTKTLVGSLIQFLVTTSVDIGAKVVEDVSDLADDLGNLSFAPTPEKKVDERDHSENDDLDDVLGIS